MVRPPQLSMCVSLPGIGPTKDTWVSGTKSAEKNFQVLQLSPLADALL